MFDSINHSWISFKKKREHLANMNNASLDS